MSSTWSSSSASSSSSFLSVFCCAQTCVLLSAFCTVFLSVLAGLLLVHSESIEIRGEHKTRAGVSCLVCVGLYAILLYASVRYLRYSRRGGGRRGRRGLYYRERREGWWESISNFWASIAGRAGRSSPRWRPYGTWNEHASDSATDEAHSRDFDDGDQEGGLLPSAIIGKSTKMSSLEQSSSKKDTTNRNKTGSRRYSVRTISADREGMVRPSRTPQTELRPLVGLHEDGDVGRGRRAPNTATGTGKLPRGGGQREGERKRTSHTAKKAEDDTPSEDLL